MELNPLVSHCTPFFGARSAPESGAEAMLPRPVLRPPQPPAPPGSTPQPAISASQDTDKWERDKSVRGHSMRKVK